VTAYRNSPTLFRTAPSLTPHGLPLLEIGGLQLSYPLLSQEQVKLRTSDLAGKFTLKICEKMECVRISSIQVAIGHFGTQSRPPAFYVQFPESHTVL